MGLNWEKNIINGHSIISLEVIDMDRKKIVAICAVIIVLGIIGSYLVISNATTPANDASKGQMGQMPGSNNGTVPQKPSGNDTVGGTPPGGAGNASTGGGTPSGAVGNSTTGNSPAGGTPPQAPGNVNSSGSAPQAPNGNGTSGSVSQAPGGNASSTQAQQVPGNGTQPTAGGTPPGSNGGLTLGIIQYILLLICDLAIAASIIFLMASKLGKENIKEVLKRENNKIIFITAIILLTVALLGASVAIANQIAPVSSGGMGAQDNSANVKTSGACVIDGTTTGNDFSHVIGGFLGIFGVDWYDKTETGKTYSGTETDQSAIVVNGSGSMEINKATVTKTNGTVSNEENSNFYGLNAALLTKTGSKLKVANTNITTSVDGANAIFATGTGAKVTVENVEIVTTADSSRGLDATYDGTIIGKDIKITTNGAHCAALATDRGEGTVTVTRGVLKTAGEGSPSIYSTGKITGTDITSTATGSEAAVIEGKNSITLTNSNLTGYLKHGVMIYQSTSGDAAEGEGNFTMTGGSLTAKTGPLFYSTNTIANINLEDVKLTGNGTLLKASADNWGKSGFNGANVTVNAKNQLLNGTIEVDNISSITMNLQRKSKLISTIDANHTSKMIKLKLSSDSTWTVTGNSYLTVITDEDSNLSNIEDNGFTIYYDKSNLENSWLNGKTITLKDGGKLTPI